MVLNSHFYFISTHTPKRRTNPHKHVSLITTHKSFYLLWPVWISPRVRIKYKLGNTRTHLHYIISWSSTNQPPSRVVMIQHFLFFLGFLHSEYLAALAFLHFPLHLVDGGEMCLTEQPLALSQSSSLTTVFFYLHRNVVLWFLHLWLNHTNIQQSQVLT